MSDKRLLFCERMINAACGESQVECVETSDPTQVDSAHDADAGGLVPEDHPSRSHLAAHSAKDKGKGQSQADPDNVVEVNKKKRLRLSAIDVKRTLLVSPSPGQTPGATYHCRMSSAQLFSDVGCPSYSFPLEGGLRCYDSYSSVSLQGTKLIAEINRLVVDYEDAVIQKDADIVTEKSQSDAYLALAKARKVKVKEQRKELATLRSQVQELMASLSKVELREKTKVQRAADKTNREIEARLTAQMKLAKQKVGEMNGLPRDKMIDYMECMGNLQIIDQIRRTLQFDFDAEVERLTDQKKNLAGSYSYFTRLLTILESIIESPFGERDAEHAEQVIEMGQEESEAESEAEREDAA